MRKPYHFLAKSLSIIPILARQKVLSMAYNSPIAGHFGIDCTLQTIRAMMNWPVVVSDVDHMCALCPIYKKNSDPGITTKAPLHPLLVIQEPFTLIVMDIVPTQVQLRKQQVYLSYYGLDHKIALSLSIT